MIHFLKVELPVCYQSNVLYALLELTVTLFRICHFRGRGRLLFLTKKKLDNYNYILSKINTFWYINIFQ